MNAVKRALGKVKKFFGFGAKEREKAQAEITAATKQNISSPVHFGGKSKGYWNSRNSYERMQYNKLIKRRRLNKIGHETRRRNRLAA